MKAITSIDELEAIYGDAVPASLTKVVKHITPLYRRWIEAARFVVVSTVGEEGTDGSPRGDDGPVVRIADEKTLLLPDWRGNNRIDTLRNIVRDGRISLMFMVQGSQNVVRVNGRAVVTADQTACDSFAKDGRAPRSVIVITAEELYFQCAKAIMRAAIWSGEDMSADLPTAGMFIKERDALFDAKAYDDGYEDYAKERMW